MPASSYRTIPFYVYLWDTTKSYQYTTQPFSLPNPTVHIPCVPWSNS